MESFFIQADGAKSTIDCDSDLCILDRHNRLLFLSLTDIEIKNRKVAADIVTGSGIFVISEDNTKEYVNGYNKEYTFKSAKMGSRNHLIIKSRDIDNYFINWKNKPKAEAIANYCQNKLGLPVTAEIIAQIILNKSEEKNKYYTTDPFQELQIFCSNPNYAGVTAYHIDKVCLLDAMENVKIGIDDSNFDWESIKTTQDYLLQFIMPIRDKISSKIKVLFDPDSIDSSMYVGPRKPLKGQVPLIQSCIEVLNSGEKFTYPAMEMGVGKTFISLKANHAVMQGNYTTLVLAPAITLTQWKAEIIEALGKGVADIIIIKNTTEFIKRYNQGWEFDKPTYFLIGKETFKLDSPKKPAINIKKRTVQFERMDKYGYEKKVKETKELAVCPACGGYIKNVQRKETTYMVPEDFLKPKKSNYRCSNEKCQSILWQHSFNKTKKTSLIRFIQTKKIRFDSVIGDEIHQSNGNSAGATIISTSTRNLLMNHCKKSLLLSGTTNSGYSSSMYNLFMALKTNELMNDSCENMQKFIKKYGTMVASDNVEDRDLRRYGKTEISDSKFREIEGVNPIVVTKYMLKNYVFATLDDISKDLPLFSETFVPVTEDARLATAARRLDDDFKTANRFVSKMYQTTITSHYINNPDNWTSIPVPSKDGVTLVSPTNLKIITNKEKELLKYVKQEISENRKVMIYTGFSGNGGEYMMGDPISIRLQKLLTAEGISSYWLKPTIKTYDRREVLEKKISENDVIISGPALTAVGVNLLALNTMMVYTPSYQVNIIKQAIRRSYRINSTKPVRVFHFYAENTCERDIIERFSLKVAESKAVESSFDFETIGKRTASALSKKLFDSLVLDNSKIDAVNIPNLLA